MNKKRFVIISIVVICVLIVAFILKSTKNEDITNTNKYEEMKKSSVMYNEKATLEELKEEYKITGPDDLYEIEKESDGRKVINVKADIKYKVAFCGMIKEAKPNYEQLDSVFEINNPTQSGIWIKKSDYSKILSYLNDNEYLKSEYEINDDGYLQITQTNIQTEYDKIIQKLINGNKQYLINISSTYYMIDAVTGEIVDNPYNELDIYQTYDYCTDNDKTIIFISENQEKVLTNDEIFISIIDLVLIN